VSQVTLAQGGEPLLVTNKIKGSYLLKQSANAGNSGAEYLLGEQFLSGERGDNNYSTVAAAWFQRSADHGNVAAISKLGQLYCDGDGVKKDHPKGMVLYQKAAEQGSNEAALSLGMEYEHFLRDPVQASQWYRRAADRGSEPAQRNLGLMYLKGLGVPRDYVTAYIWLALAAAKAAPYAAEGRDAAEVLMSPAQLADAQARVSAWIPAT
jgi:TPR repeat protein